MLNKNTSQTFFFNFTSQTYFTMMFRTVEVYLSNVVGRHDDVTRSTMDRLSGIGTVVKVICFERL